MEFDIQDFKNRVQNFVELSNKSKEQYHHFQKVIESDCDKLNNIQYDLRDELDGYLYTLDSEWRAAENKFKDLHGINYRDLEDEICLADAWMPSDHRC